MWIYDITNETAPVPISTFQVAGLDLDPLYDRIKAVQGRPGRAPIDPKILMALWLYATCVSDRGAAVGRLIWVVGGRHSLACVPPRAGGAMIPCSRPSDSGSAPRAEGAD